jgi:tetratricopeptide (TPR) repeat protein
MRSKLANDAGELEHELDIAAGGAWEVLGDRAEALRCYDRTAARDPGAAREAMRLRRDVAGLRKLAEETLARRVSLFDWFIADAAAQVGLNAEAIEIYRRGGMAEVMASDESFKPMVVHGAIQLVALLREAGEEEEARRLLDQVTEFNEAQRRHGGRVSGIHLGAAEVYALAGRTDEAFEQFALAVDAHDSPSEWPTIERAYAEPALAPLRQDPRFEVQMDRLRQRQAQLRAQLPDTFRRHGLTWPPK